jgi:hypothetical protein
MDWTPKSQILADLPETAPTKPSKPSSEGFVGAASEGFPDYETSPEIGNYSPSSELTAPETVPANNNDDVGPVPDLDLERPDRVHARRVLNGAGVRKILVDDELIVGIWSDLDSLEIRAALLVLESDRYPVRYLDGIGMPIQFKSRRVPGEAVPLNVLEAMEDSSSQPWEVRDRMLKKMGCRPADTSWREWKAAALNEIFLKHGTTGRPGRITAETVAHGEKQTGRTGKSAHYLRGIEAEEFTRYGPLP